MDSQNFLSDPHDLPSENDVAQLREAVMNEKAGPEILYFEGDLVARLETRIQEQEEAVVELEKNIGEEASKLTRIIYLYEIQRVKYLLQSYYKARLKKMEEFAMNILDDSRLRERLSPREEQYVQEYFQLVGSHLKENALRNMPKAFDSLLRQSSNSQACDMMPLPQLDRHVFIQVLHDLGNMEVDDKGDTVEFNKGDVYMVPYKFVQNLLPDKRIRLL